MLAYYIAHQVNLILIRAIIMSIGTWICLPLFTFLYLLSELRFIIELCHSRKSYSGLFLSLWYQLPCTLPWIACWRYTCNGFLHQLGLRDFCCMHLFLLVGSIFNTRLQSLTLFYFNYICLVTENFYFFSKFPKQSFKLFMKVKYCKKSLHNFYLNVQKYETEK